MAPLLALAEEIVNRKKEKPCVLIGGRTRSHILCEEGFKKLGCKVFISTDDGSKGRKGLVIELLNKVLRNTQYAVRNTLNDF